MGTNSVITSSDFTAVSNNQVYVYENDYYLNVGDNKIKISNVYVEQGVYGSKYYRLSKTEVGVELILLSDKER